MKKMALIMCLFSSVSFANELQFGFKSPAFSGNGYSSHVLTVENLEQTRKQKIIDDQKAAAAQAAADARNTNLQKFLNNLESRIYATISQNIAAQLFKDNGATNGEFTVDGNTMQWSSNGQEVSLHITDANGNTTDVVVPYGSLAW
jgi:hypothetical protein